MASDATVPRIHPNVAEVYRQRVEDLRAQLADKTKATTIEALEAMRALVERVEVHPPSAPGEGHRIELIGHLTAMLRAGGAELPTNTKNPSSVGIEGLVDECSVKVDAGTRIGLCRTLLGRVQAQMSR